MAKEEKQNPNSQVTALGGLNTDTSLVNQPQGTTRFVFTGVNETNEGNLDKISVEESNEICYVLPVGYIPLGKVYIGEENKLLFAANTSGDSLILILDRENTVISTIDDSAQTEKLGFSISQQIDATFRLRRGCERTVYWIDPKPRSVVLDKLEDFKNPLTGEWDISKFSLIKTYKKIPKVNNIEVIDGGGQLAPGSYNFSIRYLDEDFNPTEFVTSTETISIYNSALSSSYKEIRGATKKQEVYTNYENSNKSIKLTLDPESLDTTFPFYQIAITEANTGIGIISDTKFTSEISTSQPIFYYTGTNFQSSGSQEEVTLFNNIIEKAQSIEQIENTLILGNTEGKQINYCKLQKYASLISADLVTKEIFISVKDEGNSKDPAAHFHGIGYMPGEIYGFGINFILEGDNQVTPTFHIPGKSPLAALNQMYSIGANVYPMSNVKNQCQSTRYTDINSCDSGDLWGKDIEGEDLKDELVRHHRFPLRTDYGIPFVEKIDAESTEINTVVRNIRITATKEDAVIPLICPASDAACLPTDEVMADFGDPVTGAAFQLELNYQENFEPRTFTEIIDPLNYLGEVGGATTANVSYNSVTGTIFSTLVTVTSLNEVFEAPTAPNPVTLTLGINAITGFPEYTGTSLITGLTYVLTVGIAELDSKEDLYKANIFGIKFSNIQLPSLADTGGYKVIGYNIVRLERKEEEKTILDSAVLLPTIKEKNFVSQGLLFPQYVDSTEENIKLKKDILGFISPEHKFNNKKYSTFTEIVQQGRFRKDEVIKSRIKIHDVAPGSGYVDGKHKDGERDIDGFCLHVKTRDNFSTFLPSKDFIIANADINEIFYLDALEEKNIEDSQEAGVNVFNLACDNKIGILSLKDLYSFNNIASLNYVYLSRDNAEPYSNFRVDPYYLDTKNPVYFGEDTTSSVEVFNGDSYINSIKYVNSIYYDTRMKQRAGKTNAFSYVLAAVLVIAAIAITIFSAGTGSIIGAALVGAAAGLVGGATALVLSGVKQDAWNKAYNTLYKQGLRNTISDNFLERDLDPLNGEDRGNLKNPHDDEIQWLGEAVNLWFESAVNMGLRHGATDNTPDFLDAPSSVQQGTSYSEWNREYFGINSVGSGSKRIEGGTRQEDIIPTNALDFHMFNKLTYADAEKKSGRAYVGIALAEMYLLNPDYTRRNKQKIYNALGPEYDCCSDCVETFPHRWYWSEQSFQEELTDNFRTFLPNNYRDLEAETGAITDIFRVKNNLYIHTEEALWHCPQTFQERVTSDIISFIGTGSYFSIPPRKIVDDANSSAGSTHKWARIKTKYGVLFPSGKEKKWYLFNGEQLQPISDKGNSSYFRNNMNFNIEDSYYLTNKKNYPYSNNPSNPMGVGFVSAYDSSKERFLITKKDFKISNLPTQAYELCSEGTTPILFTNMAATIAARALDGWVYLGIEDCKMKFERTTYVEDFVTVNQFTTIPNDLDIYYFMDTSGSFLAADLEQIEDSLLAWVDDTLVPTGWVGTITRVDSATEKWLAFPSEIPLLDRGKVLLISFVNEAQGIQGGGEYHTTSLNLTGQPTAKYIADYNAFVTSIHPTYEQFIGINYPIATVGASKPFILHALAAVKGQDYTLEEANEIPFNQFFSGPEWSTLKTELQTNPYNSLLDPNSEPGLEQWGWLIKADRSSEGSAGTIDCPASELIISPCQFALDMNELLSAQFTVEEVIVSVLTPTTEVEYEFGLAFIPEYVNSSWTMSYSLKKQEWVGWHPYLPSFYLHDQERVYSWIQGNRNIFRHNRKGHYGNFYGTQYPFIIEYVDNPNPLMTKIWEMLLFQTEASKFDVASQEFIDLPEITFNKVLFYNSEQISGVLDLIFKNKTNPNYLFQQTQNAIISDQSILLDKNEKDWTINDLRDYRTNILVPMFLKNLEALQANYYADKIVNPAAINFAKDWTQLESFRDKFLVVRLIFDTFADVKLTFDFASLAKNNSER
jgi:hypothetical protein